MTARGPTITAPSPPPDHVRQRRRVYDILATTQVTNGYACELQWTKKSGTTYIFDAPYQQCASNHQGYWGKLLAIYGRNQNFYVELTRFRGHFRSYSEGVHHGRSLEDETRPQGDQNR